MNDKLTEDVSTIINLQDKLALLFKVSLVQLPMSVTLDFKPIKEIQCEDFDGIKIYCYIDIEKAQDEMMLNGHDMLSNFEHTMSLLTYEQWRILVGNKHEKRNKQ